MYYYFVFSGTASPGLSSTSIGRSRMGGVAISSVSHNLDHRCLLASELVHLMCLVPLFFEYLDSDEGMCACVRERERESSVLACVIVHMTE